MTAKEERPLLIHAGAQLAAAPRAAWGWRDEFCPCTLPGTLSAQVGLPLSPHVGQRGLSACKGFRE